MASTQHIAIIGGGLAGPTLALSLKKQGIASTIYKARPASYEQGNAIMIPANGTRVLDHIGIYESLETKGGHWEQMNLMNKSGKLLGVAWQGRMDVFGYPAIRIRRSVLRAELLQKCSEQGIPVIYNKRLVEVEERDKSVSLRFEGGESVEAGIVIGADGIRSVVRDYISPGYEPSYCGLYVIYGMMRKDQLRGKIKDCLIVAPTDHAGDEIAYFVNLSLPDRSDEDWAKLRKGKDELRNLLISQYCGKGWSKLVEVLCRETPAEELQSWAVKVLPDVSSWRSSSGRIIIMGDAAHLIPPAAGQGGCISLEDAETLAYVLALGANRSSYLSALEKWEKHRNERYRQVMDYTNFIIKVRTQSPHRIVQYIRDWVIWTVSRYKGAEGYKWLYGYDAADFKCKI